MQRHGARHHGNGDDSTNEAAHDGSLQVCLHDISPFSSLPRFLSDNRRNTLSLTAPLIGKR
jgi:hypothetical protein